MLREIHRPWPWPASVGPHFTVSSIIFLYHPRTTHREMSWDRWNGEIQQGFRIFPEKSALSSQVPVSALLTSWRLPWCSMYSHAARFGKTGRWVLGVTDGSRYSSEMSHLKKETYAASRAASSSPHRFLPNLPWELSHQADEVCCQFHWDLLAVCVVATLFGVVLLQLSNRRLGMSMILLMGQNPSPVGMVCTL